MVKYTSNEELNRLIGDSSTDEKMDILISVFQRDGFSEEFDHIIDNFETKPFIKNLCISSLTSLINHIDLAANGNEKVIGLVNTIFKGENALKVTDLGTEEDIKNIFKAVVNVVASSNEGTVATQELLNDEDEMIVLPEPQEPKKLVETKQLILYANKLIPTIQNLSIFKEEARKDKCNKLLSKVYVYCSETFVNEEIKLPEISSDVVWIDEFNILLAAAEPLLNIGYKIYDEDNDILIDNLFEMFDGIDKDENEKDYDSMIEELSKSKLLNVVFRSSMVGNAVDQFLAVLLQNDEAPIPKNIDFVGDNGECAILLKSLKLLIKNDGKVVYEAFKASDDGVTGEAIISAFELFGKTIDSVSNEILLDELLKSQVFHYVLSNVFYYGGFGTLEFYIPSSSLYEVAEGSGENQKIYPVIKPEEIRSISRMMVVCKDVIILLMDNDNDIDYAQIFTNQDFITHLEESVILKGTIANILINISKENDVLILPQNLDNP
ncbi:MAG: hypothetical protein K2O05_00780, partial [Anaeroplasmataceae bacterium]|nr:hypothetical protein [Anaeroplasmataceae bacterium]